jgi:hypothetical protein
MMSALLGADVSTGFVSRCLARLDAALVAAGFEDALKDTLCAADVLGTDETPAPVTASGAAAETAMTGADISNPHVFTVRTMRNNGSEAAIRGVGYPFHCQPTRQRMTTSCSRSAVSAEAGWRA